MNWARALFFAIAGFIGVQPVLGNEELTEAAAMQLWLGSPHADAKSEAFSHWNDEGEIPATCARCHSGAGFKSFYGLDGSNGGEVSGAVPVGSLVECDTCHAPGLKDIKEVLFPSGIAIAPPPGTVACISCHQGRQSGPGVAKVLNGKPAHVVDPELGFLNPHYAAAAATLYGADAQGGYEYPGHVYAGRLAHVPSFNTCVTCHEPHSTKVRVEACADCHEGQTLHEIRTQKADFDGDGDLQTGIYVEIENLKARLGKAIAQYAQDVAGTPIAHAEQYPYFFVGGAEPSFANRYASWTPALLEAAYNLQLISKDKGAYAHNPVYAIQLLRDSITSLDHETGAASLGGVRP